MQLGIQAEDVPIKIMEFLDGPPALPDSVGVVLAILRMAHE
jgi:hypothetical protein